MNNEYLQDLNVNLRDYLADTTGIPTKLDTLATNKTNKLTDLQYKKDVLLGMQDADTPITRNLGNVRESDPTGIRYDAVELRHGNKPYDMYGIDKKANPEAFGKSTLAMTKQREQVASILGKPVTGVTEQDMLDVGNQQQIQKLADLARGPGEKRWEAPLIKNSTQVNLTGKYIDDKGKLVNIPLNIDIATSNNGVDLSGKRDLASLRNRAGENVTNLAAMDKTQNAFADSSRSILNVGTNGKRLDKDYSTVTDRAINTLQGVGATLAKEVGIDTVDFVGELFGIGDVGTDQEKQTMANKFVGGYDQSYSQEAVQKIQPQINRLYKAATSDAEVDLADIYEVVKAGVLTPELMGESLGYMAGLLIGTGKFTKGAKAVKAINAEMKAGKLGQAEGLAKIADLQKAEEAMSITQKAIAAVKNPLGFAGKNAGLLTISAGNVNDQIDEYKKNNNGEGPNVGDVARMYGTEVLMNSLDRFTDVSILQNAGFMRGAKELVAGATKGQAARLVGTLAAKGAMLTADIGKEAGQEFVQEFGQMLNEQWGTKDAQGNERDFVKVLSDDTNIKQAMTAAGMGAAGAIQFRGAGAVKDGLPAAVNALGEYGKRKIELATENPQQKALRMMREEVAPIQAEAVSALKAGDTTKVDELVSQMHGKMGSVDVNAPKKYTYSRVFGTALQNVEDNTERQNVLDAMVKLGADEKSEFNAADVLGDILHGTMEEFVKTINENSLTDLEDKLRTNVETEGKTALAPMKSELVTKLKTELENINKVISSAIKGSDPIIEEMNNSMKVLDNYLSGKTVDDVNKEMATLGYISKDSITGKVDISKPGLASYERKLINALNNTAEQNNLMNEKVLASGGANLGTLANFAKSRIDKLVPGKTIKQTFQTVMLANSLEEENKQFLSTINKIKATVDNAANITPENKVAYTKKLDEMIANINLANAHLAKGKKAIARVVKAMPELADTGRLEFTTNAEGEQSVVLRQGDKVTKVAKFTKEGKLVKLVKARSKEEIVAKPTVDEVIDALENKDKYTEAEAEQLMANASADGVLQEVNAKLKAKADEDVVSDSKVAEDTKSVAKKTEPEVVTEPTRGTFEEEFDKLVDRFSKVDEDFADKLKNDPLFRKQYKVAILAKRKAINEELARIKTRLADVKEKLKLATDRQSMLKRMVGALVASVKRVQAMIKQLLNVQQNNELQQNELKELNKKLGKLLTDLSELERQYIDENQVEIKDTMVGPVTIVKESPRGAFVEEAKTGRRVTVKNVDNKSEITAKINKVVQGSIDKLVNSDSLGDRLMGTLASTTGGVVIVSTRLFRKTKDSIFGRVGKDQLLFSKTNEQIINMLPESFKEFFINNDEESKATLNANINALRDFTQSLEINKLYGGKLSLNAEGLVNLEGGTYAKVLGLLGTVTKEDTGKGFQSEVITLDPQIEEIVKFYVAKAMADTGKVQGDILTRDQSEVMRDYGIVDEEAYQELYDYATRGWVSSASIRSAIAKDVYASLGIRVKRDVPGLTENAIMETLGLLVQQVAIDNGMLESEGVVEFTDGKKRKMVRANWDVVSKEELVPAINKLQYMNEKSGRQLVMLKAKVDEKKQKMNSTDYIDAKPLAFINEQQSIPYKVEEKFKEYVEMDEEAVLETFGKQSTEGKHVSRIEKINAINDKTKREFTFLKDLFKAIGNKEFYLEWGQTMSDRITILNDIHFQESKLHRDYVRPVGARQPIEIAGEGIKVLKVAVMQGLDMKPDKLGVNTLLSNFDKMVKITETGIEISTDPEFASIKKAVETGIVGVPDSKAMNEVFQNSEGFHGLSAIHALIDLHKALVKGEKEVNPNLTVEIDAITSGMLLTLLQIGSQEAVDMAAKAGIYTDETKAKWAEYVKKYLGDVEFTPGALIEAGAIHSKQLSKELDVLIAKEKEAETAEELMAIYAERKKVWNKMKTEMFMDIYATAGIGMISEVEDAKLNLLVAEKAGKLSEKDAKTLAMLNKIGDFTYSSIRSIAKSPVMVYIYGASLNSIKKKLGYALGVETVVSAVEALAEIQSKGETDAELEAFVDMFVSNDYENEFGKKIDEDANWSESEKTLHRSINVENIKTIQEVIAGSFGKGLETSFEENFGFIDKFRKTVKSVEILTFEVYKHKLSKAIASKIESKYQGSRKIAELLEEGKDVLSKEELLEINDELVNQGYGHGIEWVENGERFHQSLNKAGDVGTTKSASFATGNIDNIVSGSIRSSKVESNTGAASTISIHAIDSRLIQDTIRALYKNDKVAGNVYDALVLALDEATLNEAATEYNTNTIETGFGRSLLVDNLAKLERMIRGLTEEELETLSDGMLNVNGMNRDTTYGKEAKRIKVTSSRDMLENILESVRINNEERVENSRQKFHSGHSHIALTGITTVEPTERRAAMVESTENIEKLLNKIIPKEDAKVIDGIIDKIKKLSITSVNIDTNKLAMKLKGCK